MSLFIDISGLCGFDFLSGIKIKKIIVLVSKWLSELSKTLLCYEFLVLLSKFKWMYPAECLCFETHLDLIPGSEAVQYTCCQNYLQDF